MKEENPEELIQFLLSNPASRSALSSFIKQTVKKNHVSTLINQATTRKDIKWLTSIFNHIQSTAPSKSVPLVSTAITFGIVRQKR